jgi:two-component system sensor histidine kinase TctE
MSLPPTDKLPATVLHRPRMRGVRSQLLTLLLPCVAVLLGLDSFSDYRALKATLESSYDEALLEPVFTLAGSVVPGPRSGFVLAPGFAAEALQGPRIQLHVAVRPLPAGGELPATEDTLLGPTDVPPPPPDAQPRSVPGASTGVPASQLTLYNARYRDAPVRIALLQREVRDASGHPFLLRAQAIEPAAQRDRVLDAALRRELVQDARMLALTIILVWLGIAWSLRPLRRLEASVLAREADDLRPLDPQGVPGEVLPLVEAINHHLGRERAMLANQQQFLADASHQLRTPLAIMMTQAGYALRESDASRIRETLRAIVTQLGRSRRLSNQLLSLAEADRPTDGAERVDRSDIAAVAQDLVLEYLPLAREKDLDLGWSEATSASQLWVLAPEPEVHEVLANLLHNAIRNTPGGGSITVSAFVSEGRAVAQVCDDGPGIAPERRERVFERFHTTAGDEGAGLGLAIARGFARRNGGDIVLRDGERPAGPGRPGLCARLEIPLASREG